MLGGDLRQAVVALDNPPPRGRPDPEKVALKMQVTNLFRNVMHLRPGLVSASKEPYINRVGQGSITA